MYKCSFLLAAIALLALVSSAQSSASRGLLQSCPIWKCASGCALEDQITSGVRRWICQSCQPSYRLLTNKRACVCPAGTSESASGNCTRCPLGSYCPSGNGNGLDNAQSIGTTLPLVPVTENITSGLRSYQITCGLNMTTRLTGSKEEINCVTTAGFSFGGSGTNATQCPLNTYNPGGNRLSSCYRCPSGLITTSIGSTSKLNCLVPAGYTMNRGVVSPCPKGSYREGTALATAQLNCTRCDRGWTTTGYGAFLESQCNFTLPGFGADGVSDQTAGNASPCAREYYSVGVAGGIACTICGSGLTTKDNTLDTDGLPVGATSSSACMNPPGYYANGNAMEKCPNTTYASGWARRTACTSCGTNIHSAQNTTDEYLAGSWVSAAPQDCFITAGYGMTFNRTSGLYTSTICPNNTYGVAETTYGLKFSPCKPCPRGLVTPGPGMTSQENCTNPAGWGWNGFTAEICPPGSWAAAGSMLACTACPMNRNTTSILASAGVPFTDLVSAMPLPANTGTDMDNFTDCKVIAGFGVLNTTDITAFTPEQKFALDVGECPIGTYSTGGDVGSLCATCASTAGLGDGSLGPYSTTLEGGNKNLTDCDVCLPGYGTSTGSSSGSATLCSGCLDGRYQVGGTTTCLSCGSITPFTYPGKGQLITANATTKIGNATAPGARSTDECYPELWQLDESMGTHLVNTSILTPTPPDGSQTQPGATDAQACADQCSDSAACIGATWIYDTTLSTNTTDYGGQCLFYVINPGGSLTLFVKVLPMDYMSGASKGSAAVTSGHYQRWASAGANLGVTISNTTATTLDACKASCDNDVQCWGFYYGTDCVLRKGLEAEGHRSWIHVIGDRVE